MGIFEAFILGIVQGATGLLPVPTDLHLELLHRLGFSRGAPLHPADIDLLRAGSALAVLAALRMEMLRIFREKPLWIGFLLLAAVPSAVFVHKVAPMREVRSLAPWGALVMAGFLAAAQRWGARPVAVSGVPLPRGELSASDALLVGLSQVAAFCPGASRLGLAFGSGLVAGLDRSISLLFALLAGVLVLGVETVLMVVRERMTPTLGALPLAVGILGAFSTTLVLFAPLTDLLRGRSLAPFAVWSACAALLALVA